MPRKFIYGPGLPGYGTAGTDGSTGLTGLAVFFSAYDGNSDTVTIKGKIIANKELFSNDVLIPGYPTRTYQSGDIFIDKNARVFQIDKTESNLYKDTGIFLNTSGFFAEGPPQTLSPGFQRYSNAFETDKFLIDVVYTNTVGDYTQYPTSIYDNGATYFGRVSYIGNDVLPDLNGWYPFEVWTIGDPNEDNAIGLARRGDRNEWHFGNYDDGSIRDASLYLDFNDIYCPSISSVTTGNILYWNTSSGRISQGAAPSGMTMTNYGADRVITAGTNSTNVNAESGLIFNGTTLTVVGNIDSSQNESGIYFSGTGTHRIYTLGKATSTSPLLIYSGTPSASGPYFPGNLELFSGSGVAYLGGSSAGDVSIYGGKGGLGTAGFGGNGGNIKIKSGDAGDSSVSSVSLEGGTPGASITILAGTGGDIANNGLGDEETGTGGAGSIFGGNAYSNSSRYVGGPGGNVYISAGRGGDGGYADGVGGEVRINSGRKYDGTAQRDLILQEFGGNVRVGRTASTSSGQIWGGPSSGTYSLSSYPVFSFNAETQTGFYLQAANRVSLSMSSVEKFRWDVSTFHAVGNIVAYSTAPSDIRLKENIKNLETPLEIVLELNGISYTSIDDGIKHFGFIAQEVEKFLPELILETELIGHPDGEIYKTIKYTEIIPYLTEAIKQQQKMIEDQGKKIEMLINEIEKLKK